MTTIIHHQYTIKKTKVPEDISCNRRRSRHVSICLLADDLTDKSLPAEGLVFVFQGDSITYGNRGRTADPNHIMGHGYAFAVASCIGADLPDRDVIFYNRGISTLVRFLLLLHQ